VENKDWIVEGNVWKVGNNVNTESITTSTWLHGGNAQLMEHIGELLIPEFPRKVQKNDIWVAGSNLGCSSSRGASAFLKQKGIGCIICHSAARIFYRNTINAGLPIFEIGEAVDRITMGDRLRVNIRTARIENLTTGATIQARPLPDFLMDLLEAGGLKKKMLSRKSEYKLLR
jgi:3-isopropylmalate/(R)-2-methylmalate dehydratase small subunit